jgi:undecaprenyl diphosphate synthase
LSTIGQSERLPASVRKELDETIRLTKNNQGLRFNLALSYGGRTEIIEAVKRLIKEFQDRKYSPEQIKEGLFARYLYTKDLPDPDLLIRTGGEVRISNFLLWQISYTEMYFTDKLWPDFGKQDLMQAIAEYGRRTRRFGDVN